MTALLFSGGLDSTALAAWMRPDVLLTVNYGQVTASSEMKAAKVIAEQLNISQFTIDINLSQIGSGSLASSLPSVLVEHNDWWPFRNQILITIGAAWSIKNNVSKLLIGSVKSDSCFSDGKAPFIHLLRDLLNLQEGSIYLEAPALEMTTSELIIKSGLDFNLLPLCFSCNRSKLSCGTCRGCRKHQQVTHELGLNSY